MSTAEHFKKAYAYQDAVRTSPEILTWLERVKAAVAAMSGVEVIFATTLQDRCEDNKPFHDHENQPVQAFLSPVVQSLDNGELIDEECLPYYRVVFADGAMLLADDAELFSMDPKFAELISAVSGAFACAREIGFAGPWHLVAEGTKEQKAEFLDAMTKINLTLPFPHWEKNINTPERFKGITMKF